MHYYKQVKNGNIVSVEDKSADVASPNFTKATKAEYDGFIASLPVVEPEPIRDLVKERMDALEARIIQLEVS